MDQYKISDNIFPLIASWLRSNPLKGQVTYWQNDTRENLTCIYMEIGGTNISIGVGKISDNGNISIFPYVKIMHRDQMTGMEIPVGATLELTLSAIKIIREMNPEIKKISISFAGPVDKNRIVAYPNLKKFQEIRFVESLPSYLPGIEVSVLNDTTTLALGTVYSFPDFSSYICVIIGTGFNISIVTRDNNSLTLVNTELGHLATGDHIEMEDMIAGMFIEEKSKEMSKEELYDISSDNLLILLRGVIEYSNISPERTLIMLQGSVAENNKVYKEKVGKVFEHVATANEVQVQSISGVGAVYSHMYTEQ